MPIVSVPVSQSEQQRLHALASRHLRRVRDEARIALVRGLEAIEQEPAPVSDEDNARKEVRRVTE